jgi:hypothetical protein
MAYLGAQSRPVRLSIGAGTGTKIFVVFFTLVAFAIAAVFVGIAWTGGAMADNNSFAGLPGGLSGGSIFRGFSFCIIPFVLAVLYTLLSTLRRAAWLTGTVVTMRGAFTTKEVDLATAQVHGDSVTYRQSHTQFDRTYVTTYRVPALAARDRSTGLQIKIPLRGMGLKRLPANELVALADAMMYRRNPNAADYATAYALANSLRGMAADPFPV